MLDLRRLHPAYRPATAELIARLASPFRRQHLVGSPLATSLGPHAETTAVGNDEARPLAATASAPNGSR